MPKPIDLRSRLLNHPLMMSQECAEGFAALAPESFMIEDRSTEVGELMYDFAFGEGPQRKPYRMVGDSAVIPITGTLLHRFGGSYSGATGYDYIKAVFDIALEDEDVKGIIFDVHSGGGQVDGAFELSDHIFANRDVKPSISVVNAHAYSAAYLLASAAGKMVVPKTGGAGSIGVVVMHMDVSKALDNMGVKISFIHAGKHKVDGNPYQTLPEGVRERIQARIDESYSMFTDAVARYRGLSTEAVKATEAQTFSAKEAVSLGLVDAVVSPSEAITAFVAELNGESQEKDAMATSNNAATVAGQQAADTGGEGKTFTQADLDAARSEGMTAGTKAEHDRISAVVNGEHFKGREGLAKKMLANQSLSADEINEMLSEAQAVVPEQTKAKGGNAFEEAMGQTLNPEVGAENQEEPGAEAGEDIGARILGNYAKASGLKFETK